MLVLLLFPLTSRKRQTFNKKKVPFSKKIKIKINKNKKIKKLEALREHSPPCPKQIITLILPTVKMLSLGCETHPPKKKKKKRKKKKKLGSLPAPRPGYATTITVCFFAHLLILQYKDHHQNLISSSLYYSGPVHKISSQSVHNFLSNLVHRQTNRQTDRQTNQRYQKHNLLYQGGKKSSPVVQCVTQ